MRLRGIELQGFKSFADRTKLTFDDGITAVVGPNGSGKSNISDAIKWVFGEQSSKSLRGTKMEDVIFGGTQTRKPQGFTWVSLFIDNTDRTIDVPTDEVVITRKLYRSGESEYRINNNLVRLKDICETFMDTGLGRDGYSIIEQGKISDIVGAKSTQRREIFEEAAGISKFRHRKGEAEHRLEQSEENLIRLRDILGELEGRVGPLKTQSEKAQHFLVYAEEKKTLELSLWLETIEKLRRQMREQEDKILVCRTDREHTRQKLEALERQMDELYTQTQSCAIFIDRKQAEIKEIEEKVSSAQVNLAVKGNDMVHNNAAIQTLKDELEGSTASLENMDGQLEAAKAKAEEHTALLQRAQGEILALQETLAQSRNEYSRIAGAMESLTLQREELREGMGKARVSSETSASLVEETVARLDNLRGQVKQKDVRVAQLREEYAQCKTFIAELTETLESLDNTRNGYRYKQKGKLEKLALLEEQQRALDKVAGEKLQRAQLLSDMERNMEGFALSVKTVMKQVSNGALRGVIGPISSLIRVEKEFSTAIEIALGAAMQNIVVENEGVAKRAISILIESKAGRCTFLPLTTVRGNILSESGLERCRGYVGIASELMEYDPKYTGILRSALGRTVIAEDLESAIELAKAYGHRFRIVTMDGQVINAGGSMTGGFVGKTASILSRKNEIEKLTEEAREMGGRSKEMEGQAAVLRQEVDTVNALMAGVEAEARTAGDDLLQASTEEKHLTAGLKEAETLGEESLREFDALTARVEELKNQGLTSGELVEQLSKNLEQVSTEMTQRMADQTKRSDEMAFQADLLSGKQIAFTGMQKDLEVMVAALENLRQQKSGNRTRLEEIQRQMEELEAANREIQAQMEDTRTQAQGSRQAVEGLNREIGEKMRERDQGEQRTTQLRQEERTLNSEKEAVSGELVRLEERLGTMTAESDGIISKLWDEYQLTKTQAAELAIPLEDPGAAQRRLGELKNKIRALGSVNVAAIEEYKEVSERYYFFKGQIDDVEKSKSELTKLIGELGTQMSQIFMEKFGAINRHFGIIFTELFGGGHGELKLTNPEDPLETGIDIFVQPSGKMVGLSLLSGGEKAIVAICIYFAILKVNPAPFVLIDEIEAALDDVNVNRFAAYLRRMTDKTQFIAITHRRGTMEEADVLYGVTMEEEGISKLLKLNISELESKLKI